MDPEWYEYYKENAYPCGTRRPQETRRGVHKKHIDDIMLIKRLVKIGLLDAMVVKLQLDHKQFRLKNEIAPAPLAKDSRPAQLAEK